MPVLITDEPQEQVVPHHAFWRPSPPKALLGSLLVSISLFYLFIYLASIAVQYSAQNGTSGFVFPVTNLAIFALWFFASTWVLRKLGWQSPKTALFAMFVVVITISYIVTSLGQTLVTYPVGAFLGICVLLIYYFLYQPRAFLWLAIPILLVFILGYIINQRSAINQETQSQAAANIATNFQYPIYFTSTIPTKQFLVQHFFWDPSKQNIRFVTKGNIAINETYIFDSQQAPPITCGVSSCIDLGALPQGQHIYTDKENPYFVEYYTVLENTVIRVTSNKADPLTKGQVVAYLKEFKKVSPSQLMGMFDHDYYLSDSYYFIPKQRFNPQNADFSVAGETIF